MVISEKLALKLFGTTTGVVGKDLEWQVQSLKNGAVVSGVFKAPPSHSTDQFDFVLPFQLYKAAFGEHWANPNAVTYVLLKEGVDVDALNNKLAGFMKTKLEDSNQSLFLQPYAEKYLYGKFENGVQAGGRITYVHLFSIIAFFILFIACINFMNLSTARASRRIKEIGIKKAVGAARRTLIVQHLGESVLMTFLSLLIALTIVILILPSFNLIMAKEMILDLKPSLILTLLSVTFITGLLAGSYPALYLSGFKPASVLKGKLKGFGGELWIRKSLVVFQFALSIIFIVSVAVLYRQIDYVHSKNLGYDKDNVILFESNGKIAENLDSFLEEIKKSPGVVNASAITNDIFSPPGVNDFYWEGQPEGDPNFRRYIVGYDFIETLGVELKQGRTFSRDFSNEPQIVINETAAKIMGF